MNNTQITTQETQKSALGAYPKQLDEKNLCPYTKEAEKKRDIIDIIVVYAWAIYLLFMAFSFIYILTLKSN